MNMKFILEASDDESNGDQEIGIRPCISAHSNDNQISQLFPDQADIQESRLQIESEAGDHQHRVFTLVSLYTSDNLNKKFIRDICISPTKKISGNFCGSIGSTHFQAKLTTRATLNLERVEPESQSVLQLSTSTSQLQAAPDFAIRQDSTVEKAEETTSSVYGPPIRLQLPDLCMAGLSKQPAPINFSAAQYVNTAKR